MTVLDEVGSGADDAERLAGRWRSATWRWALALVPPLTLLAYALTADRRDLFQVLNDDAYYYLGVARSLAEGQGSTFTGLVETNGYHPLWQLLLVPLAWVTRDPEGLVVLVVVVQGVIWAGLVHQALRIARTLGSEAAGVAAVAALGVIAVVTEHVSFNGMESALLLLVLVVAVRVMVEASDGGAPPAAGGVERVDRVVGAVLAVAFLTRLDAVFVTLPLALVLYRGGGSVGSGGWAGWWQPRRALALVGPTAGALVGYVLVNLVVFGTPTPVSGRAKSLGAPYLNTRAPREVLLAGEVLGVPAALGAVAFALVAVAWLLGRWRESPVGRRLMQVTAAVAAGQVALIAYLTFATSYEPLPWYYYNTALLLLLGGLLLADWCIAHLRATGTALCLAAGGTFLVVQAAGAFLTADNTHTGGVPAADFVRSHLPAGTVLAMGDRAGIFGFLADRPLLQLEGLMADEPFLDDLAGGRVLERMAAEGVDHYVRYSPRADRAGGDRDCWRFREPRLSQGPAFDVTVCRDDLVHREVDGDQELTIWRFRPVRNRT